MLFVSIISNVLGANSLECKDNNECLIQNDNEICKIDSKADKFLVCEDCDYKKEEDFNCKIDNQFLLCEGCKVNEEDCKVNKDDETKNGISIKFGSDIKMFTDVVKDFVDLIKMHKGDLKAVKADKNFEFIKPKLNEFFNFVKEIIPNKIIDLKAQLLIVRALMNEHIKDLNELDQFGSLPSAIVNFLEIAYTFGEQVINLIEILVDEINNNQDIKELIS